MQQQAAIARGTIQLEARAGCEFAAACAVLCGCFTGGAEVSAQPTTMTGADGGASQRGDARGREKSGARRTRQARQASPTKEDPLSLFLGPAWRAGVPGVCRGPAAPPPTQVTREDLGHT